MEDKQDNNSNNENEGAEYSSTSSDNDMPGQVLDIRLHREGRDREDMRKKHLNE